MLVSGLIMLWQGSIVSIPDGWQLCDGTNGTPDLRNRFVIGAGGTFAVNAFGGTTSHVHEFTGNGHSHTFPVGSDLQGGAAVDKNSSAAQAFGTTDLASTLPPYHALAYIMFL